MKVIVIGEGIVGLSTAYFLSRKGAEVTVVSDQPGESETNCSFGNAGMIVPSHFNPIAAPGIVKQGLKWLLDSKSPFYIKPRLDYELLSWLFKFYKSSTLKNVSRSRDLLLSMHLQSRTLFEEICHSHGLKVNFERRGLMMLYQTERVRKEEEALAREADELGVEAEIYDKSGIERLNYGLIPDVLGGVLYKSDAHLNPRQFMKVFKALLVSRGIKFIQQAKIKKFVFGFDRIINLNIEVEQGLIDLPGDEVVVCCGAWTGEMVKKIGIKLPLQGGKGYSFDLKLKGNNIFYPSILCEKKIALTPFGNELRVAGTMEISGTDLSINPKRLQGIKQALPQYFKNFEVDALNDISPWSGLRPVSPDGLPYIGRVGRYKNLHINSGHAMMGMSLGPISGKLSAEMIYGEDTGLLMSVLHPDRFAKAML